MAAIQKAHGKAVTAELIPGSGGIFDVVLDGEKIFSKFQTGRFPTHEEILAQVAQKLKKA